jgi:ectoine hydroxylase-related dioxygenase (phytanoyl-CoA dioxygenase family)
MPSTETTYDVALKVAEFKINGYTLFENLIPPEKVDRIREAFMPLLEEVRRRGDPVQRGDVRTGLGRLQNVNRYTVEVPWQSPFSDPEIYEHPALLEFLDRYWGTTDYQITLYSSNNPYPGSEYQKWHRDNALLTPHVGLPIFPHFGVKFPLVDTFEENGSFEILPGTQYLADVELESRYDEIIERGDFPKRRLNMRKGTLWIQDPRAVHRGTPNRSDHARPELVIAYSRSWYYPGTRFSIDLTAEQFEGLSERGKRLLARWRPN